MRDRGWGMKEEREMGKAGEAEEAREVGTF
jgi:hypothetical protein